MKSEIPFFKSNYVTRRDVILHVSGCGFTRATHELVARIQFSHNYLDPLNYDFSKMLI